MRAPHHTPPHHIVELYLYLYLYLYMYDLTHDS